MAKREASAPETAEKGTSRIPADQVLGRIVAPGAFLYAVLDGARDSRGRSEARRPGAECESLFAGELGEMLGGVAPYIVGLRAQSSFRRWWFEQWGNSVGILIEAPVRLGELRQHLRTLLIVRDEQRQKFYFRFYDPRVLREFLPKCTVEEVRRFFGPITAVYCEDEAGEKLLAFRPGQRGISIKHSPVMSRGHGIMDNR